MKQNKIYVVGIGPGEYEKMTIQAARILESCDVIVGYTVYVDLVKEHFSEKEFLTTPMKQEVKRCEMAFEEAQKGKTVAMICSGDAGVYGMAGLMLELGQKYPDCEVEMVAGVTAATGGAAVLGAPLIHDFALISLSDLLTPWEKIEARLLCASKADFVICLYNPSSMKRKDYLKKLPGGGARIAAVSEAEAKEARLEYRCLGRQGSCALVEIGLDTGRHHQIRVQMAHAGMPLLGDAKYGSEESRRVSQEMGIRQLQLQAVRLSFIHPSSGKRVEYELTEKLSI